MNFFESVRGYRGNEWTDGHTDAAAGNSDSEEVVCDTDQHRDQKHQHEKKAKKKKRKLPSSNSDDEPRVNKRPRFAEPPPSPPRDQPEWGEPPADLFGEDGEGGDGLFGHDGFVAGLDNKNGGAAKSFSMIDPATGLPDWRKLDQDEPVKSDTPDWIPMLGKGVDFKATHCNPYMKDWLKACEDLIDQLDVIEYLTELQAMYYKDLWFWFTKKEDRKKQKRPFYRSAIFAYLNNHNRQKWFAKHIRLIKLKSHVDKLDRELFVMEGSKVISASKDNIASYEKLLKLLRQAEDDVAKLKR